MAYKNKDLETNDKIFKLNKSIIKNSLYSVLNTLIIFGIQLILSAFLARTFTTNFYGQIQFIREIIYFLVIFSITGLKTVIYKDVAQNYDGVYLKSIKLRLKGSLISSILLILISCVFFLFLNSNENNLIALSLIIFSLIIPFYYSYDLWKFLLRGKEKFIYLFIFNFLSSIITFVLIFISVQYFKINNLVLIILLYYFPQTFINILAFKYCKKFLNNNKIQRDWKKHGVSLTVLDISAVVYSSLAPLIIGFLLSIDQVAIYSVVFQIVSIFVLLINSVSEVFLPRLYRSKNEFVIKEIIFIFVISFSIPIFLGFVIEIPILIIFTDKYASAVQYCQLFLFVIPFKILTFFLGSFLIKHNLNKEINVSKIFTVIGTILLQIILIPTIGIYGAIIGLIAYEFIQNISFIIIIYSTLKSFKVTGSVIPPLK